MPKNQKTEAERTPPINARPASPGKDARKAPSSIVPSISACGFTHVTKKAVTTVFLPDERQLSAAGISRARNKETAIKMIKQLPAPKMICPACG